MDVRTSQMPVGAGVARQPPFQSKQGASAYEPGFIG